MFERFTEKARRVIFFGRWEASQHGSESIESEHLLLAIVREDRPMIQGLFSAEKIDAIRRLIEEKKPLVEKPAAVTEIPLSPEAKRILICAFDAAGSFLHKAIEPKHILLGMFREDGCFARKVLIDLGLEADQLVRYIAPESASPTVSPTSSSNELNSI